MTNLPAWSILNRVNLLVFGTGIISRLILVKHAVCSLALGTEFYNSITWNLQRVLLKLNRLFSDIPSAGSEIKLTISGGRKCERYDGKRNFLLQTLAEKSVGKSPFARERMG